MAAQPGPRSSISHVGINAVFLRPRMGGLEAYVRHLIPAVAKLRPQWRFTVFVNAEMREPLTAEPWAANVELATHPALGVRYVTALSEVLLLGRLATEHGVDLLYSAAMTGPLRLQAPHVVLVPDLIWLHEPRSLGLVTSSLWRAVVPIVARRADRVITISEATRADLVASLGVAADRIDLALPGRREVGFARPTPRDELEERFRLGNGPLLLTVSAKRPHKNLMRLLGALAQICAQYPSAVLVMPGNRTRHEEELRGEADRLGVGEHVRFVHYVSAEDLEGLYRAAACLVYPSLLEGFGLPVLEAMQRGVPVACSRIPSLVEVAGEAARYFDPVDTGDIAAAALELLGRADRRAELIDRGLERCKRFTWEATANATIASFELAAGSQIDRRAA